MCPLGPTEEIESHVSLMDYLLHPLSSLTKIGAFLASVIPNGTRSDEEENVLVISNNEERWEKILELTENKERKN